ncbi:hypothetical protein QJS04_geneDACA017530 [Acorus gramineus]|uniref:Uncharacterized protein n=1 Tax=Acorus gramineus TaxID=55184 RepID=A0AAV9BQU8_ACOGR|nr:hypothetical protein QJS04_geneDACA017530 [Acorus gramineus]
MVSMDETKRRNRGERGHFTKANGVNAEDKRGRLSVLQVSWNRTLEPCVSRTSHMLEVWGSWSHVFCLHQRSRAHEVGVGGGARGGTQDSTGGQFQPMRGGNDAMVLRGDFDLRFPTEEVA